MLATYPTAELDVRFSEPGVPPTSWQDALHVLETAELFWLSTVRADGRPHVTPVVAVWHEDVLYFSTASFEQKMRNLEHSGKVAVTTGVPFWLKGLDVVVEGSASVVDDPSALQSIADAFSAKYTGDAGWNLEVIDGVAQVAGHAAVVVKIVPSKVLAFGKEPHAQTRYRF